MAVANKVPILLGSLMAVGLGALVVLYPKPKPAAQPVLTAEAKGYLAKLALSDVNMQAADSTLKLSLLEITGKIANNGSRSIDQVQVTCVFHEPNLQIIKRERVTVIGSRNGPLEPGATKSFRLNFDDVPDAWNQTLPDLVIAQILFR